MKAKHSLCVVSNACSAIIIICGHHEHADHGQMQICSSVISYVAVTTKHIGLTGEMQIRIDCGVVHKGTNKALTEPLQNTDPQAMERNETERATAMLAKRKDNNSNNSQAKEDIKCLQRYQQ